jgi:putative Mg2+ transporter-C (MgtC) family protein
MITALDPYRQLTMESVVLRLCLAMLFGGLIGLEGGRKGRAAGFRTYMLVCLGASLTILLGQYELEMLRTHWAAVKEHTGAQVDVARFGAQVINGIGFLGAGTILVTSRQQVKGATTAAGLWASACTGLAIGAGFYECILLVYPLVLFVVRFLPIWEDLIVNNLRNMNIYVEYDCLENTGAILRHLRLLDVRIYDVEIQRESTEPGKGPSAVLTVRLSKNTTHTRVLAHMSRLECICDVEEI